MDKTALPSIESVAQELRTLAHSDRRARLRALLPLVDELSRQGVSHESIARTLSERGMPITSVALRQALSRWRRRNAASTSIPGSTAQTTALARVAAPVPPSVPHRPAPPRSHSQPTPHISSKADLTKLRGADTIPDLNALAELGRRK